jgi:lipoyl(octanoyl) transferase
MSREQSQISGNGNDETVLHAHLLGCVTFEDALALQRRLVYRISGSRHDSALVLCEHQHLITVGREGSRAHIQYEPSELARREWPVRWVNRGGGCILHAPGQLAVYFMTALDQQALRLPVFMEKLHEVLIGGLRDFDINATICPRQHGILVGDRLIAAVGVAVRSWVTYYGAYVNLNPDLELFRRVQSRPERAGPMTSVERERRGRVRPSMLRERLLERFAAEFAFDRTSLFHDQPALRGKALSDAIPSTL